PNNAQMLLIALTGYCQANDRQRSMDTGFDPHLIKPTNFQKIRDILATVATRPRADGKAQSPGDAQAVNRTTRILGPEL
ncbi:MAG: hybrid sensor histidine kinase/response regulator, partial [Gemmatimonadota bacterium]|nr:hybrid sensor histidine kinase/response regulator [Gemmatimonadota bacterium]